MSDTNQILTAIQLIFKTEIIGYRLTVDAGLFTLRNHAQLFKLQGTVINPSVLDFFRTFFLGIIDESFVVAEFTNQIFGGRNWRNLVDNILCARFFGIAHQAVPAHKHLVSPHPKFSDLQGTTSNNGR